MIIGILSGKGGTGKTTLTVNLAAALKFEFQRYVLIIDANIRHSNIGLFFGLKYQFPYTLNDVLNGKIPLQKAVFIEPKTGIRMTPASLLIEDYVRMERLKSCLRAELAYDFVLIDSAPGLGKDVYATIDAVDNILVVTNPNLMACTDAQKVIKVAESYGKNILGVVLNRVTGIKNEMKKEDVENICGKEVISIIPEDINVLKSLYVGLPVVMCGPYSKSSIEFRRLAANLLGLKDYRIKTPLLKRFRKLFSRS